MARMIALLTGHLAGIHELCRHLAGRKLRALFLHL